MIIPTEPRGLTCRDTRKLLCKILEKPCGHITVQDQGAIDHYQLCNPCQAKGLEEICGKLDCMAAIIEWINEPGVDKISARTLRARMAVEHVMGNKEFKYDLCPHELCRALESRWRREREYREELAREDGSGRKRNESFQGYAALQNSLLIDDVCRKNLLPIKDFFEAQQARVIAILKFLRERREYSRQSLTSLKMEVQATYESWIRGVFEDSEKIVGLKSNMEKLLVGEDWRKVQEQFKILSFPSVFEGKFEGPA